MSRTMKPRRPGAIGGVRDTNRKRRSAAILAASRTLFLRHGLQAVTIDQIATRARTAKGGFYRYFANKQKLVEALFAPLSVRIDEIYGDCARDLRAASSREMTLLSYIGLAEGFTRLLADHPEEVLLYLQECRGPAVETRRAVSRLAARILERTVEVTQLAIEHGLLRPAEPTLVALAVIGTTERLMFARLSRRGYTPSDEAAAQVIELFMSGVAAV